ncbi:uncharacterized protein LOC129276001 [Lytechinus pictus]|uniref:uncharacterized protein LOC129276001 n=1 Tax=Lytechinus pictus TaxID=7653 RepID=UPI0030BA188F
MASGYRPKSPRPGRKLTVAVNIPKPSPESTRFLEPSMPTGRSPSSSLAAFSDGDASKNTSGPHPPLSPRPITPSFHHVRSPYGSPDEYRHRRHTVSVVESMEVRAPTVNRHHTFPAFDFHDDDNLLKNDETDPDEIENHQPLPASSSFFQQAMLDLKRRPSRSSQSSIDDEDTKGNTAPSSSARLPLRTPPAIEISHIEEKNDEYSLDIEFGGQNSDDEIFGSQGDENKLSSSAPDSFLHETKKSTILRLQIAKAKLSSSERALNKTLKSKDSYKTFNEKAESSVPKSARKSRPGTLLSVDVSPLNVPLRKWRSTEGSLPALSTMISSRDNHQNHSPFLSSPMMKRKGSVPAVFPMPPNLKQRSSLQDLQSSFKRGEQNGSPKMSSLAPRAATPKKRPSSAYESSTSSSSSSDRSPMASPRTKPEATDAPQRPTDRIQQHRSPISLKTVNNLTKFITSASASSSISGSSTRKNLLPDTVTLPPVLDSSGRLRVHRRRDDSMRLVRQAVNSDHNEWMDNSSEHDKRKAKSALGFAEV